MSFRRRIFFLSSTYGQNQTQTVLVEVPSAESEIVVEQKTELSRAAPHIRPFQATHQIMELLPVREDGKIWSETVTFTASKPVEVHFLQKYSPDYKPNATYGEPYNELLATENFTAFALTRIKDWHDTHLVINGSAISSGTYEFASSGVALHQNDGEPFAATYAVDAEAKDLASLNRDQ